MSFQTNRNPTIRITLLSSTLLSVRQQFQNGLSHTSCFSSLCVHRCRPLSHSTMRSKSFWNCLYIFLRLVCMVFFYGFDPTHQIKKKILWKCLSDFKKILTSLCCHQIGISITWKRRGQSFRHDLLLDWFCTMSQKGFKRNIFNNENSNIKTLHVNFDLYQWCLQFKAHL